MTEFNLHATFTVGYECGRKIGSSMKYPWCAEFGSRFKRVYVLTDQDYYYADTEKCRFDDIMNRKKKAIFFF